MKFKTAYDYLCYLVKNGDLVSLNVTEGYGLDDNNPCLDKLSKVGVEFWGLIHESGISGSGEIEFGVDDDGLYLGGTTTEIYLDMEDSSFTDYLEIAIEKLGQYFMQQGVICSCGECEISIDIYNNKLDMHDLYEEIHGGLCCSGPGGIGAEKIEQIFRGSVGFVTEIFKENRVYIDVDSAEAAKTIRMESLCIWIESEAGKWRNMGSSGHLVYDGCMGYVDLSPLKEIGPVEVSNN